MHRLLTLAIVFVPLSGCFFGTPPSTGECRIGEGITVKAQHHPGYTGPEYQYMFYTLDRDARLYYFRAHEVDATGSGKLNVAPGGLRNTSAVEARQEMHMVGVNTVGRDFNLSIAYKDTVAPALFDEFCGVVLDQFYDYAPRYDNPRIADCDGFEFTIHTEKGTHTSYSYCNEGPQGVRKSLDAIRDRAWERFGLDGL